MLQCTAEKAASHTDGTNRFDRLSEACMCMNATNKGPAGSSADAKMPCSSACAGISRCFHWMGTPPANSWILDSAVAPSLVRCRVPFNPLSHKSVRAGS